MDEMITRAEHEVFKELLEAENTRQNARLDDLEAMVHQINSLTVSVEKLAMGMDNMVKELSVQSGRMAKLEGRDGENWKKVVGALITGIIGGLVVFVMGKLGLG